MKHVKNFIMEQMLEAQETSAKPMKFPEGVFGFENDTEYLVKNFNDGFIRIFSEKNPEMGFWIVTGDLLKKIVSVQKESEFKPSLDLIQGDFYILSGSMFEETLQVNLKAPIFDEGGEYFQRILSNPSLIVNYTITKPGFGE